MRVETIEKRVFTFDELDDSAKEEARNWWRQCETEVFDTEYMYEDFARVAKILGIIFDMRSVPLMGGGTRADPKIFWSGFSSQGDGACFEGRYAYTKNIRKSIKEYAPEDSTLYNIAAELFEIQRKNFYRLTAHIHHRGHYYHSGYMCCDVYRGEEYADAETAGTLTALLRAFADWMYRALERDYDYRMANENVDESLRINEYEFLADGRRA